MKAIVLVLAMLLWSGAQALQPAAANEFKIREAKIAQYKEWLDTVGPMGSKYWVRLDSKRRPHRLYVGKAFFQADHKSQEHFVDTYSNYLAGHPTKFMLIDLFDADSNQWIGEYGFGGFKLYSNELRIVKNSIK